MRVVASRVRKFVAQSMVAMMDDHDDDGNDGASPGAERGLFFPRVRAGRPYSCKTVQSRFKAVLKCLATLKLYSVRVKAFRPVKRALQSCLVLLVYGLSNTRAYRARDWDVRVNSTMVGRLRTDPPTC